MKQPGSFFVWCGSERGARGMWMKNARLRWLWCVLSFFGGISCAGGQDVPGVFESTGEMPLLAGRPGEWDAKIRERGWILREPDGWKLWYTGYDPDRQPLRMKLGYATSPDGVRWQRHGAGPLVEDYWVEDMMVVRQDGRYYMFSEGLNDQAQLMTSADGLVWRREGTLDVRMRDGSPIPPGPFGTPNGLYRDGRWYLLYERRDLGVWLAESEDMKTWTNVSDEPVIVPGPEPWCSRMIAMNQVQKLGDRYVAVLHGTGDPEKPRRWVPFLAESVDLLTWRRVGQPLRPLSENRSSGMLIHDGSDWRLYTTHDRVDLFRPVR